MNDLQISTTCTCKATLTVMCLALNFEHVILFTGSRRRIDLDHVFDKDDMVFSDKSPGLNYSSSVPSSFEK